MYGIVNRGLEELILREHGEEVWLDILESADVDIDGFVSLQSYPDALTVKLVVAIAEYKGMSAEEVLIHFGEYWTTYTRMRGFGPILNLEQGSLEDVLRNLGQMHRRVRTSMPQMRPPSFVVHGPEQGVFRIEYHSERDGLGGFVVGVFRSLMRLKGVQGEVVWSERRSEGAPLDVFELRIASQQAA